MIVAALSFIICHLSFSPALAQVDTWKAYMSYYEPQQIVKAGSHTLFVRASNSLYSYNLNDESITTYDKVNSLSDTYISLIGWNQTAQRLLIVYSNSNFDLMDLSGNVTNLSALYSKSMTQDKTVNSIYMSGIYAYLATGFGAVKVNLQRAEIAESYILDQNITAIGSDQTTLYLRTSTGTILSGLLSKNLIDPHNWSQTGTAPAGTFTTDLSDWNQYISTVRTLQPGGPRYNNFGFMRMKNGVLYTVGGDGFGNLILPATVQIKQDDEWVFLQDDMTGVEGTGNDWTFVNMYALDVDPFDSKHIFAGGRTGLFEYYDGELVKYYNKDNSILKTATTSNKYVITNGVTFDSNGNLWIIQGDVTVNSIIEIKKDGQWINHPQQVLIENGESLPKLGGMIFDSRGLMWFVNSHWGKPSFYCYNPATDSIVCAVTHLVNQDGTSAPEMYNPKCVVEDLGGNIWIGTANGPYLIESERVGVQVDYATQVKVPRNDGTNLADYLLAGVDVSAIAIDGGNRKWFGTLGSGVYLISDDNIEQVYHFTSENSPLPSNIIESIAINQQTGEVFFGTDQGLCSYMSNATEAAIEMVSDDVYAYPNPVVSGYEGQITVVGLSRDADVKILSTNGQLVAQGRSNGGMFTWNGRNQQGRLVASGIYMVCAATSEGKKGVVCKIAVVN